MAKHTGPVKQEWVAAPNDAINLAALRWYACTIERICIEIYATNRTKFPRLEALLNKQVKELKRLGASAQLGDEDDCPPGYVMCEDRLCAPSCDFEAAAKD
jgi:hypothetical protein